jgi:hypothetical protein
MRVTRPARIMLAEAMVFAATTLAAASVLLPVTNTGAAMCGATGAPAMDPWFRRFELEGADLLPGGPPWTVGRCRRFPQDFHQRFSGMIKQRFQLLF